MSQPGAPQAPPFRRCPHHLPCLQDCSQEHSAVPAVFHLRGQYSEAHGELRSALSHVLQWLPHPPGPPAQTQAASVSPLWSHPPLPLSWLLPSLVVFGQAHGGFWGGLSPPLPGSWPAFGQPGFCFYFKPIRYTWVLFLTLLLAV